MCMLLQFMDKKFPYVHDLTISVEFGARIWMAIPSSSRFRISKKKKTLKRKKMNVYDFKSFNLMLKSHI